jgi:Kef-type K+ transport system membrane component KefB
MEARPGQLAIGLGQIGEFSFVLASVAAAQGAIDRQVYVALLAAVVVTILGSTILVRLAGTRPMGDSGLPEAV